MGDGRGRSIPAAKKTSDIPAWRKAGHQSCPIHPFGSRGVGPKEHPWVTEPLVPMRVLW